ncbi:MAG: PLP-dependent aminotransferase family protein [Clostridia bacterium]|nr:PLP-dependent aminotransferase family protein [Clostridia bacterium]
MNYSFSDRISNLKPSAIREILKATSQGDVIPFAAGNPAPEAFPVDDVRKITAEILEKEPITALQYGITEGYTPLRNTVKNYMKKNFNVGTEDDEVIITSGAQQVIDLASKVLLNEDDVVISESPSFIGALNTYRSYKGRLVGVDVDSDGMNMEKLEEVLKTEKKAKFIYTIPNFQNPSGVTMSWEKRKRLYELAKQYGVLILEDNPYGDLRYSGEDIPCIKSIDTEGIVIYSGSFSKILSPGLRVAFTIANKELIAKMTVGKQASDVHTPVLNQLIVNEWMNNYDMAGHINKIRANYGKRLDLMCSLIDSELGDFVKYLKPEGGLFIWCELPENVDMMTFANTAAANKVAVVPGTAFMMYPEDKTQCIRLNFSTPTEEGIVKGMKILGEVKNKF